VLVEESATVMTDTAPSTVLVYVGLDRVGDGLLKLPFARGLREAYAGARITWVAGKETSVYAGVMAPLVAGLLDEVIEYAGIGLHPSELLGRPLGGRRFDLVIDTQRIFWASLSLWRVPHKTFISPAARFLLSSKKPPPGYRFPKSMQRQMLDLLEIAAGRPFPSPDRLDLDLDAGLHADAARLLPDGPVYVGLAPGSGGPPKCWPLERFIALARAQVERGRAPVFILGPQEVAWTAGLRDAVPQALFPLQGDGVEAAHGFSPLFTIALVKRLAMAVSNDSGVNHMLAIAGLPLVSLYGVTTPAKFPPMGADIAFLHAGDFGGREMSFIPVGAVIDAADAVLGRGRA
jgi:ADP-heptose:LPS heptosyltransferase